MLTLIPRQVLSAQSKELLSSRAIRNQSTKAQDFDPLSILTNVNKSQINSELQFGKDPYDPFSLSSSSSLSFLGNTSSSLKAKLTEPSALEYVTKFPLFSKQAGRTIMVRKGSYGNGERQLDQLIRANQLKTTFHDQRFYTKPCKVRLNRKLALEKKKFDAGIAQLFSIVRDAVRKGY